MKQPFAEALDADRKACEKIGEDWEAQRLAQFEEGNFIAHIKRQFPSIPEGMPEEIAKAFLPSIIKMARTSKTTVIETVVYSAVASAIRVEVGKMFIQPMISENVLRRMRAFQKGGR